MILSLFQLLKFIFNHFSLSYINNTGRGSSQGTNHHFWGSLASRTQFVHLAWHTSNVQIEHLFCLCMYFTFYIFPESYVRSHQWLLLFFCPFKASGSVPHTADPFAAHKGSYICITVTLWLMWHPLVLTAIYCFVWGGLKIMKEQVTVSHPQRERANKRQLS